MLFNIIISQKMRNFIKIIACFFFFSLIVSCGGFSKKLTQEKLNIGPERAKKNVKEGRGVGNWSKF